MEQAERDGLCDDANLGMFQLWYALGNSERGLTLGEIKLMTAAEIKDWLYLTRRTGRILQRQAKEKKNE